MHQWGWFAAYSPTCGAGLEKQPRDWFDGTMIPPASLGGRIKLGRRRNQSRSRLGKNPRDPERNPTCTKYNSDATVESADGRASYSYHSVSTAVSERPVLLLC